MTNKLSQFSAVVEKNGVKDNHKLSYEEVLEKLNQIESVYVEIMGPKSSWNQEIREGVEKTRLSIKVNQCASDYEDMYWYEKE